jgi:ubiquinone/menaquinone biosynthesis C-methylase UbiE
LRKEDSTPKVKTQEAYNDWSSTYDQDRNLTRDLDRTVTRNILANLRCQSVLELGCGTGKNSALLSEIGKRVYAFDFSAGETKIGHRKCQFRRCRLVAAMALQKAGG